MPSGNGGIFKLKSPFGPAANDEASPDNGGGPLIGPLLHRQDGLLTSMGSTARDLSR